MSARLSRPSALGPLEAFAVQFDPLLKTPAQRHGFRTYLSGLLLPRDRSKTLTALVGAEPLVQAQAAEVQRLQFFLSEAAWGRQAMKRFNKLPRKEIQRLDTYCASMPWACSLRP